MQGHFDLVKYGTRGLKAEDFDQAIKDRCLDELLAELPEHQRARTNNRIFDNMAGYVLQRLFQVGTCEDPYSGTTAEAALAFVCFLTTDGEPSYTENWAVHGTYSYNPVDYVAESIGTDGAAKLFINESIYGYTIAKVSGTREAIYYKDRFFYNTWEALTSGSPPTYIRSLGIYFKESATTKSKDYYDGIGRLGRCRLKNSRGETVVMHKTSYEVLQLEYTFSLVSY